MAEFPALPLWTDAYLGDTTHLSTIEHGAYLLLLMTAWRTADCALPDDDKLLARYARLDARQWKRMKPILADFFIIKDGKWRQRRLDDEREAVMTHKKKMSERGHAGAAAKALKTKGRHQAQGKTSKPCASAQDKRELSSHSHIKDIDKSISKKTSIPDLWQTPSIEDLPPKARALAEQWPTEVYEAEGETFVSYWRTDGGKKIDWIGTFANRIIARHEQVMRFRRSSPDGREAGAKPFDLVEAINANPEKWRGSG